MINKKFSVRIFYIILGSFIFALSINLFVLPINIYNGGITGVSQLLNSVLHMMPDFPDVDLLGTIILLINIPFFIFAWNRMSRRYVILNIISVVSQSIFLSLIPVLEKPIFDEKLLNIIVAAVMGAYGISLLFKVKGSSGGLDILGIYLAKEKKMSVGTVYTVINTLIYVISMILFDVQTALYSVVYSYLYSKSIDSFHEDNLESMIIIFTKNPDVKERIISDTGRGVTAWDGIGVYTKERTDVLITIVAKSEIKLIRNLVNSIDPNSFIIVSNDKSVYGNFEKRLI